MKKTQQKAADSGEVVVTQFGRACQQLGIKIITAHSPAAKGRVERTSAMADVSSLTRSYRNDENQKPSTR